MDWLTPPVVAASIAAVVTVAVAVFNLFTQARIERSKSALLTDLERRKAEFLADLERTKASLADEASARDARRSYEFDARKRLYAQLEPLFFQLFEAAEGSYFRVSSLVRTQREGFLGNTDRSWICSDGYYLRSTVYRLMLPLAIFRLIQRSATFVDLALDDNIRMRYALLRMSYFVFTDDFTMARKYAPYLDYEPNHHDWQTLRDTNPARHRRQGFVIGHLDRLIDALIIVDGGPSRPMTYGEFEDAGGWGGTLVPGVDIAADILLAFCFPERPVLARILYAHACVMKLLLSTYESGGVASELPAILDLFMASAQAKADLHWWTEDRDDPSSVVQAYLHAQLRDRLPPKYARE